MLLQYFLIMSFPLDTIHAVKCTSSSYSKAPTYNAVATSVLQSSDGVLTFGSFILFSSKCNSGHYGQTQSSIIRPQNMSPKNCNYLFIYLTAVYLCSFWSNGFFLSGWPFNPLYWTCFIG
ncbi:hypothetical protein CHARACLAT_007763 [Characodon lateralis]|uniref:Uncharacterized protein n=1 Tax=Characodon lateralis TaxID=208331 RepID=A0ABU7EKG8_9TELE|nr:hypothetical protein [Characodon lateralis]